tara:strand:+ start:187 stop:510 length:324 start_codon:yes stop_codon:yes gene_type:complete
MGFTAVYLPSRSDGECIDEMGFTTEEEALEYIKSWLCNWCLRDLSQGYADYGGKGKEDMLDIRCPLDTSCGAEWLIMTDEDYEKAETTKDLFVAGGLKRIYKKDDDN